MDQTVSGQTFRLTPGDSLHYNGAAPHGWANPTDAPARILWSGTLRVLHRKGAIELPELSPKKKAR